MDILISVSAAPPIKRRGERVLDERNSKFRRVDNKDFEAIPFRQSIEGRNTGRPIWKYGLRDEPSFFPLDHVRKGRT